MLRIFGRRKFYLKNTHTIEQLAQIDTAIFDKTGTITTAAKTVAAYQGMPLTPEEESLLKSTLRSSNHPLSRSLYEMLSQHDIMTLDEFEEHTGKGISAQEGESSMKIGSAHYVGRTGNEEDNKTSVHIQSNDEYKGRFVFNTQYRDGASILFTEMANHVQLAILSGDNDGEKARLQELLPLTTPMFFNQKPVDKLHFIEDLQKQGKKVLMVGDGLNDAGALAQANVGLVISENINVFSPACDAILDASKFTRLYDYIRASKKALKIIKLSFLLSLFYNLIGLYFAVTGQLEPVIAAILMPLSSISIVAFTTIATNIIGRKLK
mgnify:FL=1